MSVDGGRTFAVIPGVPPQAIPSGPGTVLTFNVAPGTTLGKPLLVLRLNFTLGQSNGVDLQNEIDNIQVNGTIVPEPATIAGGLLACVCGAPERARCSSNAFRRSLTKVDRRLLRRRW